MKKNLAVVALLALLMVGLPSLPAIAEEGAPPEEAPALTEQQLADEQAAYEAQLEIQAEKADEVAPGLSEEEAAALEIELGAELGDVPEMQARSSEFEALSVPGFTPGNLISDFNFYDSWAMSESEIQAFLQAKVGSCQNSYCLANLKVDTPTMTLSFGTCSTYQGAKGESAARIIFKVQRACGLSAKAILVTLQKEQSLITKPAPTAQNLRAAMGQGCPDTAACDSAYYGFFMQVYSGARQLTWYNNPSGSFTYIKVGQSNSVRFHPNASCGASNVTIQNKATAALYYYTPYQPNAAALNAGWGTGDGCSSYGNRNFYNYFRTWFGDPKATTPLPVSRLAGADRYTTAVAVSKHSHPTPGVPVVYVATGEDYPDAISAAPAAAAGGGPLLLVKRGSVPGAVLTEIKRLKPQRIVVVGSAAVVSSGVESTLRGVATTTRVAGANRYETSRRIADHAFASAGSAYLATGRDFPDALSAGAAAGKDRVPVILIDGQRGSLDAATNSVMQKLGVTRVSLVGSAAVVSSGIESSAKARYTVERLAGSDRYATNVAVNKAKFGDASAPYIATAMLYPDALTGAAAAGTKGMPLYLSRPHCVPSNVRTDVLAKKATSIVLLGSSGALDGNVARLQRC